MRPVGIIHTSFRKGASVQRIHERGSFGLVVLNTEYMAAFDDIRELEYILLFYTTRRMKVGLLGMSEPLCSFHNQNIVRRSMVRLLKMGGGVLFVADAYLPDGAILLDAKPCVPDINQALISDDLPT